MWSSFKLWSALQESRAHLIEKVKTDRKIATYLNFDGLVTAEMGGGGGPPTAAAIQGAVEFALDCMRRRGKHRSYNFRTKRLEFRHVKRQDTSWTEGW